MNIEKKDWKFCIHTENSFFFYDVILHPRIFNSKRSENYPRIYENIHINEVENSTISMKYDQLSFSCVSICEGAPDFEVIQLKDIVKEIKEDYGYVAYYRHKCLDIRSVKCYRGYDAEYFDNLYHQIIQNYQYFGCTIALFNCRKTLRYTDGILLKKEIIETELASDDFKIMYYLDTENKNNKSCIYKFDHIYFDSVRKEDVEMTQEEKIAQKKLSIVLGESNNFTLPPTNIPI